MVVVVQPVLTVIGDEDVGPAVVVEVTYCHSKAPAIVGDTGLCGDVGEGAVVVVVKERGVRRLGFAV